MKRVVGEYACFSMKESVVENEGNVLIQFRFLRINVLSAYATGPPKMTHCCEKIFPKLTIPVLICTVH